MKQCPACGAQYPDHATVCATDYTPLVLATTEPKKPHSGLGITSFVMSIVVGVLVVALIALAGVLSAHRTPGSAAYPGQTQVGVGILFLLAVDFLAVGLGIASLFQTAKNRLFGTLGLIFSGLIVLGTIGLIILGLMLVGLARH